MSMRVYMFLVLSIVFLTACDRTVEEFDESKFGYDYFPLEVGKSWLYQVDSIIYDDEGSTVIETSALIREDVVEEYVDDIGDTIHRIERYWRPNESASWIVTDVWVASKTAGQAFRTEENLKFVKLVFPVTQGKSWDGNIYINDFTIVTVAGESLEMFAGWDNYRIISVDEPEEIGGVSYDKVTTVVLNDDQEENTIKRRYAVEKYARGFGLVSKEYIILDSQDSQSAAPWTEKAEKGFILNQVLLEYN